MMIDETLDKNFVSKSIYGSITSLAILFAMDPHPPPAWQGAVTLFGTAFVIAVAEAYSATIAETLAGKKELNRAEAGAIWRHARPILIAAIIPSLVLVIAATGRYSMQTALLAAEIFIFFYAFSLWAANRSASIWIKEAYLLERRYCPGYWRANRSDKGDPALTRYSNKLIMYKA